MCNSNSLMWYSLSISRATNGGVGTAPPTIPFANKSFLLNKRQGVRVCPTRETRTMKVKKLVSVFICSVNTNSALFLNPPAHGSVWYEIPYIAPRTRMRR